MNKMWSPSVIKSDILPIDLSFNESKISPNIRRINNGGICHFLRRIQRAKADSENNRI